MKSKMLKISIGLLIIGVMFIALENHFYQFVDENGVLHESMFMPLGALCVMLGIIGLTFSLLKMIWMIIKNKCRK